MLLFYSIKIPGDDVTINAWNNLQQTENCSHDFGSILDLVLPFWLKVSRSESL